MRTSLPRWIRPAVVAPLAVAGLGLAVSACNPGATATPDRSGGTAGIGLTANGSQAAPSTTAAPAVTVSLQLQTGKQDGKPGWPRYTPSDVTVAAGSHVHLVITSYDDGAAPLPAGMTMYDAVQGGTETVNGTPTTSVPNAQVAHTFSVPALGVNVVIPAVASGQSSVTVAYDFTAGKAGTYTWKCFAPCGDGPDGMAGAMTTAGWMTGSLTID